MVLVVLKTPQALSLQFIFCKSAVEVDVFPRFQTHLPRNLDGSEVLADRVDRRQFVDLLKRMLSLDQDFRISPKEALNHPFITMAHLSDYGHTYK